MTIVAAALGGSNVDVGIGLGDTGTAIRIGRIEADRLPEGVTALADQQHFEYWIVDASGYLAAEQRAKGRGGFTSWALGLLGSIRLDFTMRLGGRRPYGSFRHVTPVPVDAIDAAFDDLWARCRAQMTDQLVLCRDAQTLQDVFSGMDPSARLLRFDRDNHLCGYLVMVRHDDPSMGLRRFRVVDMLVDADELSVCEGLFSAAYEYATAKRCHILELVRTPAPLRAVVTKTKPYQRSRDGSVHGWFGPRDRIADWYATGFDEIVIDRHQSS